MGRKCIVCGDYYSSSFQENKGNVTFHTFPKDENLRKQWFESLNISMDFKVSSYYHTVCSSHFAAKDFKQNFGLNKQRSIKREAVPSLEITEKYNDHRYISSRDSFTNENTDKKAHANVKKKFMVPNEPPPLTIRRFGDVKWEEIMKSPKDGKICWEVAMDIIREQRKELKLLKEQLKRLREKMSKVSKKRK